MFNKKQQQEQFLYIYILFQNKTKNFKDAMHDIAVYYIIALCILALGFLLYVGIDITKNKLAEIEIASSREQLAELSSYLQKIKEQERARVAKEIDGDIKINFIPPNKQILVNCDNEQINRVFLNLIKNSIESIKEKISKNPDFTKKIDIAIINKNDYIQSIITDNGTGFSEKNLKNILKPYFTTKSKGSGLGLSIVNKIINDHNGTIKFIQQKIGAKIIIKFKKNVN